MEINTKVTMQEFEVILNANSALMVYFFQEKCGVCTGLFPKVKSLVTQDFPKMELLVMDAVENRALAAQLQMMSIPGILVYFDGKEFFRGNGLVSVGELKEKINRFYDLMFS